MVDSEVDVPEEVPEVEAKNSSTFVLPPNLEKDENELFKMRAKLFRWAKEAEEPEWKERGTGDVQLLQHKLTSKIRLLMRRDKTFKTCANHYLVPSMELHAMAGSDRAWLWTAPADFADEEAKEELLAIRFLNAENAGKFKEKFTECQELLSKLIFEKVAAAIEQQRAAEESDEGDDDDDDVTQATIDKLGQLTVESGAETAAGETSSAVDGSTSAVDGSTSAVDGPTSKVDLPTPDDHEDAPEK